jgi:hypothetical protein
MTDYEAGFAAGIDAAAKVVDDTDVIEYRYCGQSLDDGRSTLSAAVRAIRALRPAASEPMHVGGSAATQDGIADEASEPAPVVLGCAHGRPPGQPCPHCLGIGCVDCRPAEPRAIEAEALALVRRIVDHSRGRLPQMDVRTALLSFEAEAQRIVDDPFRADEKGGER